MCWCATHSDYASLLLENFVAFPPNWNLQTRTLLATLHLSILLHCPVGVTGGYQLLHFPLPGQNRIRAFSSGGHQLPFLPAGYFQQISPLSGRHQLLYARHSGRQKVFFFFRSGRHQTSLFRTAMRQFSPFRTGVYRSVGFLAGSYQLVQSHTVALLGVRYVLWGSYSNLGAYPHVL